MDPLARQRNMPAGLAEAAFFSCEPKFNDMNGSAI
jgi:hypothetical protein